MLLTAVFLAVVLLDHVQHAFLKGPSTQRVWYCACAYILLSKDQVESASKKKIRPSRGNDSGPSTSSSSGPAAVDSSGSELEDSQEPVQAVDVRVVSLLSRLKSPRPSDFARKRKIAANPVLYVFLIVRKGHFVEKKTGIMGTFFSIIGTFLENCFKA